METTGGTSDTLLNILLIEKETFWTEHAHFLPEDIQRLWSARAEQLTSVLGPAAPTQRLDLGSALEQQHQRVVLHGPPIPTMVRRRSDLPMPSSLDREENLSQHSAPYMSRKRSSGSRNGPIPFSSNGGVVPPLTINNFQSSNDEPFSNYTVGNATKMRRTASGRQPLLQRVPEISVYENPADYYNSLKDTTTAHQLPSTPQRPRRNSHRLSLSPRQASSFGNMSSFSQSPATPTTGGLTNATTYTSGMSRQSSIASGSICGGIDMIRLDSHTSDISNFSMGLDHSPIEVKQSLGTPNNCKISLSENDRSHFLGHTGGVVNSSEFHKSSITPVVSAPLVPTSLVEEDVEMKRSTSTESNASSQSRASRRRQEQLVQSSRPIAPKPFDDEASMSKQSSSSSSSHQMIRIRSADGSSKEVVSISKTPYVRPAHEKIKCTKCTEQPEGFRGEHELRRHTERAHNSFRKAFVCVDISPDKAFLANCKACRLNKRYGAYYNAAAHLRRAHFNPKQKGRKGKAKAEEKRGGIGGGNYPSMEILKMWMKEIEEFVPENMPQIDDNDAVNEHLDESTLSQLFGDSFEDASSQPPSNTVRQTSVDHAAASTQTLLDSFGPAQTQVMSRFSSSAPVQSHASSITPPHISPNSFAVPRSNLPELVLDAITYDGNTDDPQMLFDMSPLDQPFDEFDSSNLFPGLS